VSAPELAGVEARPRLAVPFEMVRIRRGRQVVLSSRAVLGPDPLVAGASDGLARDSPRDGEELEAARLVIAARLLEGPGLLVHWVRHKNRDIVVLGGVVDAMQFHPNAESPPPPRARLRAGDVVQVKLENQSRMDVSVIVLLLGDPILAA
jgi:hypothetical protein